jgi:hypothetical protein
VIKNRLTILKNGLNIGKSLASVEIILITLLVTIPFNTYAADEKQSKQPIEKLISTEVKNINGIPTIVCNYEDGQKVFDQIPYISYDFSEQNMKPMSNNGTSAFGFMFTMSNNLTLFTNPIWRLVKDDGKNLFDFSLLDKRMDLCIATNPNSKVLIRFFVGAPQKWINENPEGWVITKKNGVISNFYNESTIVDKTKNYCSIAYDKLHEVVGTALKEAIKYCEGKYGNNILGYTLGGLATEEWYHIGWHNSAIDDYSLPMQNAFKQWLKNKYGTEKKLQESWNKPLNFNFDNVTIPEPDRRFRKGLFTFFDPKKDMDIIDYNRFNNVTIPMYINDLSTYAKKAAPNKVIGCIYGYEYDFGGDPLSGQNGLDVLLANKNLDFIKVEADSLNRSSATGGDGFRGPLTSILLAGKAVINDNDSATYLLDKTSAFRNLTKEQLDKTINGAKLTNAYTPTAKLSSSILKRIHAFAMTNGFLSTNFDLHGGYYNDSYILSEQKKVNNIYKNMFTVDRTSVAQVLIISDTSSYDYFIPQNIWGSATLSENIGGGAKPFVKIGAPYDCIMLNDLDKVNLDQYKAIYFFGTYNVTDQQRQLINTVKGKGRTLIWSYAPGLFNNNTRDIKQMNDLTGISFEEKFTQPSLTLDESSADPLAKALVKQAGTENMGSGNYAELFFVKDMSAITLGKSNSDETKVTMAYKDFPENGGWRSIYIPFSNISDSLLKALIDSSGVHIYSNKKDSISANKSLVSVHAIDNGERIISFEKATDVWDAFQNIKIGTKVTSIKVNMTEGETKYFAIDEKLMKGSISNITKIEKAPFNYFPIVISVSILILIIVLSFAVFILFRIKKKKSKLQ